MFNFFKRKKKAPEPKATFMQAKIFPGQQLWQLNLETMDIDPVTSLLSQGGNKYAFVAKDDCMYEVALTKRNAMRKLKERIKIINQQRICKQ